VAVLPLRPSIGYSPILASNQKPDHYNLYAISRNKNTINASSTLIGDGFQCFVGKSSCLEYLYMVEVFISI
jgi:hypothetical protein